MIQFDSFMQAEGVPIYQQIIRYVKQGIAAGTIRDGEELPSRRVLSALRQELTETELRAMVRSMKRMGLDRQSAWSLFERLYAEEETE